MRPGRADITTTRSARKIASAIEWVTKAIVLPVSIQISWISIFISSRVKASSAPKGSSISSTEGLTARLLTIEARCCIPPESSRGNLCSKPFRLTRSSRCWMRCMSGRRRFSSNGSATFLSRLRHGKRLASWKITAISGCGLVMTSLPSLMRPAVRSCSPAIDHSRVVFPQPEGPRMQRNSPSRTSSDTLSSACTDPDCVA